MTTVRYTTLPIVGFGQMVQYDTTGECDYIVFGPGIKWYFATGTPNGDLSGTAGDLYTDMTDGVVYHCSGTTTWDAMSD